MLEPNVSENSPVSGAPDVWKSDVLRELHAILESAAFRTSLRAREFLSYVVSEALEGNSEALKERSIGINLYQRSPTYVTGDDPIVRVKAGEVRRRLLKYYAESPPRGLKIELPVGSYVPQFHGAGNLGRDAQLIQTPEAEADLDEKPEPSDLIDTAAKPVSEAVEEPAREKPRGRNVFLIPLAVAAALIAGVAIVAFRPSSCLQRFWAPLLSQRSPVLVCVSSPVSYALSSRVLKQWSRPPQSATALPELLTNTVPVTPNPGSLISGSDLTPLVEYFVNKDDAYTLAEVSKVLVRLGQNAQTRIGKDLTFADLRSSPSVLIGAFDNAWTLEMSSDLPYRFAEVGEIPLIEDNKNPARTWHPEPQGRLGSQDFAIVARLLNSKSGQPMVIIAGTGMAGTEAAGRTLCNEELLRQITAGLPKDWARKNLEIVLETDQVDGSSSRSRVVAVSTW